MAATQSQSAPPVNIRAGVRGTTSARTWELPYSGKRVVTVRVDPAHHRGALPAEASLTIERAAQLARAERLPLVGIIASSGADIREGASALDGWARAARAISACSGMVPVCIVVTGFAVAGPALLLGLADIVVMTPKALAYVSGPAAVRQLTAQRLEPEALGGPGVHARSTGVAALEAADEDGAIELIDEVLSYLPDNSDSIPARVPTDDPVDRRSEHLRTLLPDSPTGSYDVREIVSDIADDGEFTELRARWAPQIVTAFCRISGHAVGVLANQPQSMAGTLDISASQKGAAFVGLCDSFNLPLLTVVDTPGFMPGKDLEWRGMIRHGAQLVSAYAEAQVPRICLIVRKAFGGAYIVMDSKGMGSDVVLAWPSAQIAVMGAQGAVQILHRREDAETQARLVQEYEDNYLTPYIAAERGFVDQVIDPADTRAVVCSALEMLAGKREKLGVRKHSNGPL